MGRFLALALCVTMVPAQVLSASSSRVSINSIEWVFDREYTTGTFANGDPWVVGPVVITEILPRASGGHHGWEVNPEFHGDQAFDSRVGEYDSRLCPGLPYRAQPGESIVKAVSRSLSDSYPRPALGRAAVLTVLAEVPPDNGASVFRPPYVGDEKPLIPVSRLRTDLLPSLPKVDPRPTLEWVHDRYHKVQLDHKGGRVGRYLHPSEHMPNYGGDIGRDNGSGALRLMLDDPLEEKMPALIAYVQYGIDLYYMVKIGHVWPAGGGHRPGQKLPISFAAVLLDDEDMKDVVRYADVFHEDHGTFTGEGSGVSIYGFGGRDEESYWRVLVSGLDGSPSGNKSIADPYGYIDGGPRPGQNYQYCCTSQPWKGSVIACYLMPQMKELWLDPGVFEYTERYVNFGLWTQPDPCAPADNNWSNYGVTFGPDGRGGCIKDTNPRDGIGRFPQLHGTQADEGGRYSHFQAAMWDAYRDTYRDGSGGAVSTLKTPSTGKRALLTARGIQAHITVVEKGIQVAYTLTERNPLVVTVHDLSGRQLFTRSYELDEARLDGTIVCPLTSRDGAPLTGACCVTVKSGSSRVSRVLTLQR
ncbi:MAG: hypothetical protein GF331_26335 [Chitinivibrionales bacterium]|nr:hypothetical protein [Chitinivibrionales bacterium]